MDNWFLLYLLTRFDSVNFIICAALWISLPTTFAGFLFSHIVKINRAGNDPDETNKEWDAWVNLWEGAKHFSWVLVIAIICFVLIPTKQEIFFIVGGSALIDVAKSDDMKRVGGKSLQAVESWLDQNMPKEAPKEEPKK